MCTATDTMTAYLSARVDAAHVMDSPPERRVTALEAPGRTYMDVMNGLDSLMRLVGPYLDLSHIAVMRPGWWDRQRVKFRWFKQYR